MLCYQFSLNIAKIYKRMTEDVCVPLCSTVGWLYCTPLRIVSPGHGGAVRGRCCAFQAGWRALGRGQDWRTSPSLNQLPGCLEEQQRITQKWKPWILAIMWMPPDIDHSHQTLLQIRHVIGSSGQCVLQHHRKCSGTAWEMWQSA